MDDPEAVKRHARILWNYNRLSQPPRSADLLIVMGHNDLGVPAHAARLCKSFDYTSIIVTGGVAHDTALHGQPFGGMEADIMSNVLISEGVDPSKIYFERQAKNTGDNITYSKDLAHSLNLDIRTGQLVHVPSMERRALATAEKQWPDVSWSVSSQDISFDNYVEGLEFDRCIQVLVGDTYRIIDYPRLGFQTVQPMPDDVLDAMKVLIEMGYGKRVSAGYNPEK